MSDISNVWMSKDYCLTKEKVTEWVTQALENNPERKRRAVGNGISVSFHASSAYVHNHSMEVIATCNMS